MNFVTFLQTPSCCFPVFLIFVAMRNTAFTFLVIMYFNHVQNTETVKIMSSTKQEHDDLQRAKYQLETELENLRREKSNVVRPASDIVLC